MSEQMEELLSVLETEQLKGVAEKFGIDCSKCKRKEEYVITISDSQKFEIEELRSFLGLDSSREDEGATSFGEAEKLLSESKAIYDSGDYIASINKATEALDLGAKALNEFYGKGLSYAIRSSEKMISNLKDMDIDASSIEEILTEAKQSHENQEYEYAQSVVIKLRDAISDLINEHAQKIADQIEVVQTLIDGSKEMGADVSAAESKLAEARQHHAGDSLPSALDAIKESEQLAQTAREGKVQEISDTISRSAKLIEDAKYLHAPVSEAEELLEAAKSAFDEEDYALALKNANSASDSANVARDEQIKRALSLQEKIKEVPSEAEAPEVAEAEEAALPSEEAVPAVTGKVCPNCGGEPTYVEQYERYYCYPCSEYIEPVEREEEVEVAAEPEVGEAAKVCPGCGGEPTYVEQYKKYYCYSCEEYVEPQEKKVEEEAAVEPEAGEAAKVCPGCGGEPTYVEQYKRYYCYECGEYVEPQEKKVEEEAAAEPEAGEAAKVCPGCGGEPTYVEEYKRYYCYTCSEYVEPSEKKVEKAEEVIKPTKEAKVCPTCGDEPTYVEEYKRYYCYTCSQYVEPTEKSAKKEPEENICPTCGEKGTYVEEYKRYYCYTCSKYL
ncbi:MAG: hypothetical protein JSW00_01460 [Thermoplasmata archaeon]|nr:MAG: hypothetical protein JSW00_01460 [Thermoplasmata archaeon]